MKDENNSVSTAPREKKNGMFLSYIYVLNHICGELGFTLEEGYSPAPTKKARVEALANRLSNNYLLGFRTFRPRVYGIAGLFTEQLGLFNFRLKNCTVQGNCSIRLP